MTPDDAERTWLALIANNDELLLESLLNPRSSQDHFFRLKAEPLLDHPRLYRVARKRVLSGEMDGFLVDPHRFDFEDYLSSIDEESELVSGWIPYGYVLSNQPEAMCIKTDGGAVVVVSEVLRNALFFMNIGFAELMGFDDIPPDVRSAAIAIAARTMNMDEALDFELDPRGDIPAEILARTWAMVSWQMKFVIGHEFAHHRLGHLDQATMPYHAVTTASTAHDSRWLAVTRDWQDEFDADMGSIEAVSDQDQRGHLGRAAILFFLYLIFFEETQGRLNSTFETISTHPPTHERLRRIAARFGREHGATLEWVDDSARYMTSHAKDLMDLRRDGKSLFGWYGSVYLGQWKKKMLVDRVDY